MLNMLHVQNVDETALEMVMQQACTMLNLCTEVEFCVIYFIRI
jgi:hypothetical protein